MALPAYVPLLHAVNTGHPRVLQSRGGLLAFYVAKIVSFRHISKFFFDNFFYSIIFRKFAWLFRVAFSYSN